MEEKRKPFGKRSAVIAGLCVIALFAGILILQPRDAAAKEPTLMVETPPKISRSETDELSLDVRVSALGEASYPAASVSISFDSSCLEFLGVEEGNVFVHDEPNAAGVGRKLPEWSCNPEQCNKTGLINIMYLDLTGGTHAFGQELLAEEDNVLLRLKFRLRGSARVGDVYELIVEDAVFAASDERLSLATAQDTLKAQNGRIVVGE